MNSHACQLSSRSAFGPSNSEQRSEIIVHMVWNAIFQNAFSFALPYYIWSYQNLRYYMGYTSFACLY